jgi:hypothetical protein
MELHLFRQSHLHALLLAASAFDPPQVKKQAQNPVLLPDVYQHSLLVD